MERESKTEEILARFTAAKEKAANDLKKLLQRRTQEALKRGAFEGVKERGLKRIHWDDLNIEGLLLKGGILEDRRTNYTYDVTNVVLRSDGKLYRLRICGEPNKYGDLRFVDWSTLEGELTAEEYFR